MSSLDPPPSTQAYNSNVGLSVAQKARVRVMLQVPHLFLVHVPHTHTPSTCHPPPCDVMLQEQYKAQDEAMGVGNGGGVVGSESAGLARSEVT